MSKSRRVAPVTSRTSLCRRDGCRPKPTITTSRVAKADHYLKTKNVTAAVEQIRTSRVAKADHYLKTKNVTAAVEQIRRVRAGFADTTLGTAARVTLLGAGLGPGLDPDPEVTPGREARAGLGSELVPRLEPRA